jgi:hypothetical protein
MLNVFGRSEAVRTPRIFPRLVVCLALAAAATSSQTARGPFAPIPARQRAALSKRLAAYTHAYSSQDWSVLYDLVSENNRLGLDGKLKVTRAIFVRDMTGSYDLQRLIGFVPVRTEPAGFPAFYDYDIYGCGKLPFGDETLQRVVIVRASRENKNWFFVNWAYADPPEDCSRLSDSTWKPRNLHLDAPMSQLTCDFFDCEVRVSFWYEDGR